jgi:hypothetical protein
MSKLALVKPASASAVANPSASVKQGMSAAFARKRYKKVA